MFCKQIHNALIKHNAKINITERNLWNLQKKQEEIEKQLSDGQKISEELQNKCIQLEKRINQICNFIQGSYTNQINQNFAEIQAQIDMLKPITNAEELAKHFPQIKQKAKKCSTKKHSAK